MKPATTIVCLLLTAGLSAQSRVYKPFPLSEGTWIYCSATNPAQATEYVQRGDTLLSGTPYKKLYENSVYRGALRENDKRIYLVPDTSQAEYLLYDFHLQPGDTVRNPIGGAICISGAVTVQGEDSLLVGTEYHRALVLSSMAQWIEGIGSRNYFLNPAQFNCLGSNTRLEQMVSDLSYTYTAYGQTACLNTSLAEFVKPPVRIHPNPFSGFTSILLSEHSQQVVLEIRTLSGEILRTEEHASHKPIVLTRGGLNAGLYLLTIRCNGQPHRTLRLLVTD